jgi:hypothetical protein
MLRPKRVEKRQRTQFKILCIQLEYTFPLSLILKCGRALSLSLRSAPYSQYSSQFRVIIGPFLEKTLHNAICVIWIL